MKIALYNIDSIIPNIALMKISAYYKKIGHKVEWFNYENYKKKQYKKIYASKIFKNSKYIKYKNMVIGGSGIDITIKLPKKIDLMKPDYSIYPDYKDSIGFVTRGCIRNCSFCIVRKKEGVAHIVSCVEDIWRGGNLILLDNNILVFPDEFKKILIFCKKNKITVDFNQGLDCRLVSSCVAIIINTFQKQIKPQIRFAFDSLDYKEHVERTCKLIKRKCFWYVYCDKNWESALERLLILKRYNQDTYLMRHYSIRGKENKMFNFLAHWSNYKGAMRLFNIWEYFQVYYLKRLLNKNTIQNGLDKWL